MASANEAFRIFNAFMKKHFPVDKFNSSNMNDICCGYEKLPLRNIALSMRKFDLREHDFYISRTAVEKQIKS